MRTTLSIDDELMQRVKRKAAKTGMTITEVIEEALRHDLADTRDSARFGLHWKPVEGSPAPGVDLTDRDAIYERMEHQG